MDVSGEDDLFVLVGDDRPVDFLGHLDEPDRPTQDDDGQAQAIGRRGNGLRYLGVEEFGDHADRAGGRESLEVSHRVGEHRAPGGEDQFAPLEKIREIGEVADVHPAHLAVETAAADEPRLSVLHRARSEHGRWSAARYTV